MKVAPAFQTYAKDVLAECTELSDSEIAALSVLRCHAWLEGSIPGDAARLARILRRSVDEVAAIMPIVEQKTVAADAGRRVFPELEKQRQEHDAYRESQRQKINARWERERQKKAVAAASRADTVEHTAVQPRNIPGLYNSDLHTPICDLQSTSCDLKDSAAGAAGPADIPPLEFLDKETFTTTKAKKAQKGSDPPLPYTLATMLETLAHASGGKVVTAPFSKSLTKPLTAVVREVPEIADITLFGEFVAAGGYAWMSDPIGLKWLAKGGNVADGIGKARSWRDAGRPTITQSKGNGGTGARQPQTQRPTPMAAVATTTEVKL